jgi:hypothetical protein
MGKVGRTTAALARLTLAAIILVVAPMIRQAAAQGRGAATAEFIGGWIGFGDSGVVSEVLVGGAGRVYLHSRVGVGPELTYIVGQSHTHLMLTANLTWDLAGPPAGGSRAVTPYLVVGGGLFHTSRSSLARSSTSNEAAFTIGAGARWTAGDRVTVGVDARLGGPPHFRISGLVGVHLGR